MLGLGENILLIPKQTLISLISTQGRQQLSTPFGLGGAIKSLLLCISCLQKNPVIIKFRRPRAKRLLQSSVRYTQHTAPQASLETRVAKI